MENQIEKPEENESADIIPGTSSNKMKKFIYQIACILLFAAGVVFFICFYNPSNLVEILNYSVIIVISAFAAVFTAARCFYKTLTKTPPVKFTALIIAGIVLAANWFIYFRYIPKYEPRDAYVIVKADPKYASAIIKLVHVGSSNQLLLYETKDNPFWELGYLLDVISDGKLIARIAFDPATGKYGLFEYQPVPANDPAPKETPIPTPSGH